MIKRIKKYCLIKRVLPVLFCLPVMCLPLVGHSDVQALEQLRMFNDKLDGVTPPPKEGDKTMNSIVETREAIKSKFTSSKKKSGDKQEQEEPIEKNIVEEKKVLSDDDAINEAAFEQVKKKMFPLKTEQVKELHKESNAAEFALTSDVGTPPRPAVTTQIVRLDPGSTPSVIRLGQGFISSVVFLDSTGAPWPIIAYDLGDPTSYNIQWDKSGNTMMIQSKKMYTYGNMAVRLQGLNTPVMLTLVPGQKAIDYRVDMRVMGFGPNAKNTSTVVNLPAATSDVLMQVLDDIPPPRSKLLMVKGGPAKAWTVDNTMYVRTQLTILSPGWLSMMTSADGMHVYKMSDSPILLVSWHGKVMQLKIEGL